MSECIKTFEVQPHGKKFETICRIDGCWSISFLSKNKKAATKKGREFVSGARTSRRTYVTKTGQAINEIKSKLTRKQRAAIPNGSIIATAAIIMAERE